MTGRGCSSVETASGRRAIDTGSTPLCGKVVFCFVLFCFSPKVDFQFRLCYDVRTAPVGNSKHQNLCVLEKSQALAAIALFGHTKILLLLL